MRRRLFVEKHVTFDAQPTCPGPLARSLKSWMFRQMDLKMVDQRIFLGVAGVTGENGGCCE